MPTAGDNPPSRRSPRLAAIAVITAVVAAGAMLTAVGLQGAEAHRIGAIVPVDPTVAADPTRLDANNSPSLARSPTDPARLALVNRIDSPQFSCALHISGDGGASWSPSPIPFPAGEELPERCYAPDAAFAADGTLHVVFVTLSGLGNRPNAAWLSTSSEGGRTLSAPTKVLGPLAFQVRLAADPSKPDVLYLTWLQATDTGLYSFSEEGYPILVARSDDAGATWGEAVRVSPPARAMVVAPTLRVGPAGPYLSYLDLGDDRLDYHGAHEGRGGLPYDGTWSLVLARSDDGGRTWREATVDDSVVPIERFVVFLPATPALVVDASGQRVYLAFHDARLGDADVWVWSSGDGGATFERQRVNDTAPKDGRAQYLPQLALADGGRLDVVYYDRRADLDDVHNEVSLQSSSDGGRTFSARVALSDRSFDSRIGFGSERELADLGSRLALVSDRQGALAVWTDTRAGTEASAKQDLAQGLVELRSASVWRGRLRLAALVLCFVALIAGCLFARRPPPAR